VGHAVNSRTDLTRRGGRSAVTGIGSAEWRLIAVASLWNLLTATPLTIPVAAIGQLCEGFIRRNLDRFWDVNQPDTEVSGEKRFGNDGWWTSVGAIVVGRRRVNRHGG